MKKNLNKLHPNTCRALPEAAEHGTAVYAVIGDPIEHSRSPEIYAPMFGQFGINAVFFENPRSRIGIMSHTLNRV